MTQRTRVRSLEGWELASRIVEDTDSPDTNPRPGGDLDKLSRD
ncbi:MULTISPECIES: hypothetical protein [unclassified Streptomyces]